MIWQIHKIGLGTKSPRWIFFILAFFESPNHADSKGVCLNAAHFFFAKILKWHVVAKKSRRIWPLTLRQKRSSLFAQIGKLIVPLQWNRYNLAFCQQKWHNWKYFGEFCEIWKANSGNIDHFSVILSSWPRTNISSSDYTSSGEKAQVKWPMVYQVHLGKMHYTKFNSFLQH